MHGERARVFNQNNTADSQTAQRNNTEKQHRETADDHHQKIRRVAASQEPGCLAKPGFAASGAGDGRPLSIVCTVRERRGNGGRQFHWHCNAAFIYLQRTHSAMLSACATDDRRETREDKRQTARRTTEIALSETISRDEGGDGGYKLMRR
jgi:hypothetical protein